MNNKGKTNIDKESVGSSLTAGSDLVSDLITKTMAELSYHLPVDIDSSFVCEKFDSSLEFYSKNTSPKVSEDAYLWNLDHRMFDLNVLNKILTSVLKFFGTDRLILSESPHPEGCIPLRKGVEDSTGNSIFRGNYGMDEFLSRGWGGDRCFISSKLFALDIRPNGSPSITTEGELCSRLNMPVTVTLGFKNSN